MILRAHTFELNTRNASITFKRQKKNSREKCIKTATTSAAANTNYKIKNKKNEIIKLVKNFMF